MKEKWDEFYTGNCIRIVLRYLKNILVVCSQETCDVSCTSLFFTWLRLVKLIKKPCKHLGFISLSIWYQIPSPGDQSKSLYCCWFLKSRPGDCLTILTVFIIYLWTEVFGNIDSNNISISGLCKFFEWWKRCTIKRKMNETTSDSISSLSNYIFMLRLLLLCCSVPS